MNAFDVPFSKSEWKALGKAARVEDKTMEELVQDVVKLKLAKISQAPQK